MLSQLVNITLDHGSGGTKERKFLIKGETADGVDGDLFYSYKNDVGSLDAVNYKGKMTVDTNIVTKKYVDDKVAGSGGGVPVGSIMMWINAIAPSGWLKLKGGSFDINAYPLLHAYLQQSDGYVSGKLPDWRGHYPGQIGDHLNGDVGIKLPQQTAKPSGGSPHSSSSFNNGENKTANKAGSTDFAGIRKGQVSIDSGWDEVTRPKTVAVHFIIKHD